jgi:FkbH-like protein
MADKPCYSMKYSEILKANTEFGKNLQGEEYTVAILSNIITSQLSPVLEYVLRADKVFAKCVLGDYDNIVQDSAKFKNSNLVLIVWDAANLIDGFQYRADVLSEAEIEILIGRFKNEIDMVIAALEKTSSVVITKFSSTVFNYHFIKKNNFDRVCDELNQYLKEKAPSNYLLFDIDKIFARISVSRSVDFRNFYSSKALYTTDFYYELSKMICPYVLSIFGMAKKAIIFDCDNTLWNGVVGEDGPEGIKMSAKEGKGVFFEEVQYLAKSLAKKGVIIGINSKNNPEDVTDILFNHKDISLSQEEIIIQKVNWVDKVSNLTKISEELNIGIDSLMFVDDSDFEINLVNQYLPMVKTVQVPLEHYLYPDLIRRHMNLFFNNNIVAEDVNRVQMYKEQAERQDNKNAFENLEEYIRSLELGLTVYKNNVKLVPRMAQLTQKTNQFNLTTKRYTESDISSFINSPNHRVLAFGLKDKYGDFGITGEVILTLNNKEAEIDTFLMSCRVLGRNVEKRFLQDIVQGLEKEGVEILKSSYRKTKKNQQVRHFYDDFGFRSVNVDDENTEYVLNIKDFKYDDLKYINVNYEE